MQILAILWATRTIPGAQACKMERSHLDRLIVKIAVIMARITRKERANTMLLERICTAQFLPKNPRLADFLIRTAAQNRYGEFSPKQTDAQLAELAKLDELAERAREVAVTRPR